MNFCSQSLLNNYEYFFDFQQGRKRHLSFDVSLENEEEQADFYSIRSTNCDDFQVAWNGGRSVGAHVLVGAGQVPTAGSGFCLWLSLTQITESCIWEP